MSALGSREDSHTSRPRQPLFALRVHEDILLVDAKSFEPIPGASRLIVEAIDGDDRFARGRRPGCVCVSTDVCLRPSDIAFELACARTALVERLEGRARLLAAGAHPTALPQVSEHGPDLGLRLRIEIAAGSAERAFALTGPLRSFLPEIAALAGNARFERGNDTGWASTPAARHLAAGGDLRAFLQWRQEPPCIEFSLDTQTSIEHAAGLSALCQALVIDSALAHAAGRDVPVHPPSAVRANLQSALEQGLDATLADLVSGTALSARARITWLLMHLYESSAADGFVGDLDLAWSVLSEPGATRQRRHVQRAGRKALPALLVAETERSARRAAIGCDESRASS